MGPEPDFADALLGRLPPVLKWCFAGMGAIAGYHYARTDASPIPLSYIALGAVTGFLLLGILTIGLRSLKMLTVSAICLLVLNYAVLIPFGYGDQLPVCVDAGRTVLRWLNPVPIARRWGKNVEPSPRRRIVWP